MQVISKRFSFRRLQSIFDQLLFIKTLDQGISSGGKFTPGVILLILGVHLTMLKLQYFVFSTALVSKQKQGVNFMLGSWPWVAERFSKWGAQIEIQKNIENFSGLNWQL